MIRTKSPSPRCCSILSRQFDAAGPILANLLLPRPDRTESQWRRRFSVPRKTSRNFDFVPFPFPTIHPRHFYFQNGIYIYIHFWFGIGNENASLEKIRMPNLEGKSSPRPNQNPRIVGQPSARQPTPANVATLRYFFTCARNIG